MELHYSIIYSKRKKISITVERDRSVVVHVPVGTAPEKIQKIVESRKQWIYAKTQHPQKYDVLPHPPGKELVNGESMLYLGRNYRIELVEGEDKIRFDHKFILPQKLEKKKRMVFKQWYIDKAQEIILPRISRHAKNLGVEFQHAKIMDCKYRWGSCTPKDNLNFNWRLIKAPMFVIDYIIIHELAHLLESNHTPRFWNIIRAQITDMEKAKSWLLKNGSILEWDI